MRAPLYEAAKINLQRSRFYAASLLRSTRRTHPHGNNQRRARNVSLGLIRGPKIHSRGRSVCSVVDGGLRWEGEARPGVSMAAKKGTILAAMAASREPGFQLEPFPLIRRLVQNGPEPSRARRCWARRSEPFTARTVLG
jgi:hypothetical protein